MLLLQRASGARQLRARARLQRIYGEEVTRMLDALAGNTYMTTHGHHERRPVTSFHAEHQLWRYVTDTHFRRAAVIMSSPRPAEDGMTPQELRPAAVKIQRSQEGHQARHAGRNAMLNFNRMSWPEKAIARHLFFIYAFMRASAAYTLHYLFEHPAQYAALNASGRERENLIKELIGDNLPQWFYDQGWIAIGPGEVINPNQLNMAGTINQLANPLHAMFSHTPYGSGSGLLQLGPTLFTEALTGRSLDTGQAFTQGSIPGAFLDAAKKTPIGRAVTRAGQKDEPQEAPPMSAWHRHRIPISAAMASERAAIGMPTSMIQDFWDTYGGSSAAPPSRCSRTSPPAGAQAAQRARPEPGGLTLSMSWIR
jgi:hypothetical protein